MVVGQKEMVYTCGDGAKFFFKRRSEKTRGTTSSYGAY